MQSQGFGGWSMLYFPLLDVCFTSHAHIMEYHLVLAGQAVVDPPHRDGGYKCADDDERLYRLLYQRACDMESRSQRKLLRSISTLGAI